MNRHSSRTRTLFATARAGVRAAWVCALFLAAVYVALAGAPAAATEDGDFGSLLACQPQSDGTLEYRARYLEADWVTSGTPGEPDLVIALLARVLNQSAAPLTLPNPLLRFHDSVRVRYNDGSLATNKAVVFRPREGTHERLTLGPHESVIFGQGVLIGWAEAHTHQVVEKKVLVIGEVRVAKQEGEAGGWSGCIESRIGDVSFPPVETSERYHANQSLEELVSRLRSQYRIP